MGWFNKSSKKQEAEIPDGLFIVCSKCKAHVYKEEFERAFIVVQLANPLRHHVDQHGDTLDTRFCSINQINIQGSLHM